jgi:potassium-transporting ATPase KdpC subunit
MKEVKTSLLLFLALSILTGVLYPSVVTVIAQSSFPHKANGSLIYWANGTAIGSAVVGQPFSDPGYFWSRPSATADGAYNGLASGGSNLGPTNKELIEDVKRRVHTLGDSGIRGPIPADLVTASASGLDPHISPAAALIQIPRIAIVRSIPGAELQRLVKAHTEGRQLGFLGASRVNVLELNLALDKAGR